MNHWYALAGINPEPWTAATGARTKDGIQFYKNEQLRIYQLAVKSEFARIYPDVEPYEGELDVRFWFWRQISEGSARGRTQHANYADTTNLQKSTEDALQGLLYPNDRTNLNVSSTIMAQGPAVDSAILILVSEFHRPKFATPMLKRVLAQHPQAEPTDPRGRRAEPGIF